MSRGVLCGMSVRCVCAAEETFTVVGAALRVRSDVTAKRYGQKLGANITGKCYGHCKRIGTGLVLWRVRVCRDSGLRYWEVVGPAARGRLN